MARRFHPVLLALPFAVSCLTPQRCTACRYNVRETGFVDLGTDWYALVCYAGRNVPPGWLSGMERVARAAFRDSPIALQIVPAGARGNNPALKYRKDHTASTSFVLVSPDERSRPIPVHGMGLQTVFRQLATSRFREVLVQHLARHYAVVLLLEGPDAAANARAKQAAGAAIENIGRQMKFMPKTVARGPVLLSLGPRSFSEEKILLWSLGVENDAVAEPHTAVLYGRGRRIGGLLKGGGITAEALEDTLALVGADCECGLDPQLIRGTALPVRWNRQARTAVAGELGFDPDNPMVMTEVSYILKIRAALDREPVRGNETAAMHDPFVPYVEDKNPACARTVSASPLWSRVAYILSGAAALVVFAAVGMVLRARRRNSCH